MPKISAVIITMNEEKFIERCLSSLDNIADEIIVVDSYSTDATEEVCRKFNVKFYQHEFKGFMNQKNYAVSLASHKHILSLDADEALSEELQKSLLEIKHNMKYDGYYFNRLSNYCGQWIKHSAWYPDRQLRLFNSEKGNWGLINVHESFQMNHDSRFAKVKGDLLHWPCTSEEDLANKIEKYSDIAASEYLKSGVKVYFFTPWIHGIWRFILTYIIHLGFLDGRNGYIICHTGARSSYLKYAKLLRLKKESKEK
jgi:glycosyltransferase involved in cell wall biosynthesis